MFVWWIPWVPVALADGRQAWDSGPKSGRDYRLGFKSNVAIKIRMKLAVDNDSGLKINSA